MTVICCVCGKVKQQQEWVTQKVDAREIMSHGYCPECAANALVEIRKLNSQMQSDKAVA